MAIALVAHTVAQSSNGGASVTTPSTSGWGSASLIFIAVAVDAGHGALTISDSTGSNTYTQLTAYTPNAVVITYYCANPTVTGSMTFSCSGTGAFPAIAVAGFSGVATTTPHDQENGAHDAAGGPISTGTITPTTANQLLLSAAATSTVATTPTFNSGSGATFTQTDSVGEVGGQAYGIALAYNVQTTATTESVTWTEGSNGMSVTIESFKASGAAPSGKLFMPPSLNGISTGGPFFSNPLG